MSRRSKAEARRGRRWAVQDERWPEPEEIADQGQGPFLIVDYTSGGAPFGVPLAELRESMLADSPRSPWVRAYRAIMAAAEGLGLRDPDLGRVCKVGEGRSRHAMGAEVLATPGDRDAWARMWVALVPRSGRPGGPASDAIEREARLLTQLAERDLEFRVPRPAVAADGRDVLFVGGFVEGAPVDLRAGRMSGVRPWEVVGGVAAAIHRLATDELEWLPGHASRREHGLAVVDEIADLEGTPNPIVREAVGWLRANLPPDEPAVLLHGELLGENLRIDAERPPGVLGWEHARRGDPAHELAVVTRGARRPFQLERGMVKLLAAYDEGSAGSGTRSRLREPDVRFHEIGLHLKWYGEALAGGPDAEPIDAVLGRLRNLLKRR